MHLKSVTFHPDRYPTQERYPFNLDIFRRTGGLDFRTPVTLFVGENGAGKSTLLEALAIKAGIHRHGGMAECPAVVKCPASTEAPAAAVAKNSRRDNRDSISPPMLHLIEDHSMATRLQ